MKYHYIPTTEYIYHKPYEVDHPLYDRATLYSVRGFGLCIIQQRVDGKKTYWTELDEWLVDDIARHWGFNAFFWQNAAKMDKDGFYPTVTVRQIMWALRMKPLGRERWETVFDHKPV